MIKNILRGGGYSNLSYTSETYTCTGKVVLV